MFQRNQSASLVAVVVAVLACAVAGLAGGIFYRYWPKKNKTGGSDGSPGNS